MTAVRTIAAWELRAAVRSRWVAGAGLAFAAVMIAIVVVGLQGARALGLRGVGSTTAALLAAGLLLPSLLGLLLGSGTISGARERGDLSLMLAQPVGRWTLVAGTFVGLTAAIWLVAAAGFGVALLLVSTLVRASDIAPLLATMIASFGLAAVCLALGTFLASLARSRTQAAVWAVGLWLVLALGVDLGLAALMPSLSIGPGGLLAAVMLDPVEAARVGALLGASADGAPLGPFGGYLLSRFGWGGALALIGAASAAWIVAPLAAAWWTMERREA